jgi:hypothetical protein
LKAILIAALAVALSAPTALAATQRSRAQREAFFHSHPCPSTGKTHGRCPGYVVDHVTPLCAGGADASSNMAWQEIGASKIKDKQERKQCAALRHK